MHLGRPKTTMGSYRSPLAEEALHQAVQFGNDDLALDNIRGKGVLSNSDQDITIQQEASPWRQNVLGGDVSVSASKYQLQTGKYFLCNYKDQYQFRFSSHLDFQ
ncbi:hypothetical protein ACE6H2_009462 [Prunus campanulata]